MSNMALSNDERLTHQLIGVLNAVGGGLDMFNTLSKKYQTLILIEYRKSPDCRFSESLAETLDELSVLSNER